MRELECDDWAYLYRHDRPAFDARRDAALAIAVARGSAAEIEVRRVMSELEADLQDCASEERTLASIERMAASLARLEAGSRGPLGQSLGELNRALASVRDVWRETATR